MSENQRVLYELDEVNNMFEHILVKVKKTEQIPLHEIEQIMPLINKLSDVTHFHKLFYQQSSDTYSIHHPIGVAIISTIIGKWMNFSDKDLKNLTMSALLHDIGNFKIPQTLFDKQGKLTREEYDEIKMHTINGYELLLKTKGICDEACMVALQHHERENGLGYPNGLKGNQIHIFAKIVAIADEFHALLSKRNYQNNNPLYHAIKQMNIDMYGKFDANILLPFIKRVMDLLIGHKVLLNDGRTGVIIMMNKYHALQPLIQIGVEMIDLSQASSLEIESLID